MIEDVSSGGGVSALYAGIALSPVWLGSRAVKLNYRNMLYDPGEGT